MNRHAFPPSKSPATPTSAVRSAGTRLSHRAVAAAAGLLLFGHGARAVDFTWTPTAGGSWSTGTNWTPTAPAGGPSGSGLSVLINTNITATSTISLYNTGDAGTAVKTVGRLDIGDTDGTNAFTISAGSAAGVLNFDNTVNSANAQLNALSTSAGDTISAPVTLSSSLDITNGAANIMTLSGGISAASAGTKTITFSSSAGGTFNLLGIVAAGTGDTALVINSGTVRLTASSGNTFGGGVTLNGGTVDIFVAGTGNASSLGTGTFTINGGSINNTNTGQKIEATTNAVVINGDFSFIGLHSVTIGGNGTAGITMAADHTITLNTAASASDTFNLVGVLTNTGDSARTLTVNLSPLAAAVTTFSLGGYALTGPGSTAARNDVINGSATLGITGAVTDGVSPGSGLTYSGTGVLTLSGVSTYTGPTLVASGGRVALPTGSGLSSTTAITDNGTLTLTRTDALTQGTNFGSSLAGSGTLAISGTGGVVTLNAANPFSGTTTVAIGSVLSVQNGGALGTSTTTIASGAALQLQGGVSTTAGASLSIAGEGIGATSNPGALRNISGNNTFNGAITESGTTTRIASDSGLLTLAGPLTTNTGTLFFQGNADITVSGVISGVATLGHGAVGAGVLTLSGANTYTGQTVINGGTVSVASLNSVNAGTPSFATSSLGAPTTVAAGTINLGLNGAATLRYTGTGETTDRVINLAGTTGNGSTNTTANTIDQSGTGLLKFTSSLTSGAGAKTLVLQGSTAGTGEIAGVIPDRTTGSVQTFLTKAGTGAWTLSGVNTYTGATSVTGGTLLVNGSTVAASAVTVSGGLLGGTGTVAGTVQVNSGGTISPGPSGSVGNLTTGMLTLAAGSTFNGFIASDSSFSQLLATATSAAGGFTISLLPGATFAATGEDLTLIPSGFSGTFTNSTFTVGGYTFTADYSVAGAFGVDVRSAVPEPGTYAMLLAGLGIAIGAKRLRKARAVI